MPSPKEETYNTSTLETVAKWIVGAKNVFFYTGAGMSVASGIPTFRGRYGLWKLWKSFIIAGLTISALLLLLFWWCGALNLFTYALIGLIAIGLIAAPPVGTIWFATGFGWTHFPRLAWVVYKLFFFDNIAKAKLNKGHGFMKFLKEKCGKKVGVFTSNVDCLEREVCDMYRPIHGTVDRICCNDCHHFQIIPIDKPLPWFNIKCEKCGSRSTRTGCLLFADSFWVAMRTGLGSKGPSLTKSRDDVYFVIGSSGMVEFGCSDLDGKTKLVQINITETPPYDLTGGLYTKGHQDRVLEAIMELVKKYLNASRLRKPDGINVKKKGLINKSKYIYF